MSILHISGSPRLRGNTTYLLDKLQKLVGGETIRLADHQITPCTGCWACVKSGKCNIDDSMSNDITPRLLAADIIVLASPVFFNNVTAQMKLFIDRTWPLRGQLHNKIGGAIVVGRRYGSESAITAINAFFLKHEMIPANRGVSGIAYEAESIRADDEALTAIESLALRLSELAAKKISD